MVGKAAYRRLFVIDKLRTDNGHDEFVLPRQWYKGNRIVDKSVVRIPNQLWFSDIKNETLIGKSIFITEEYFNTMKIEQ